MKDIYPDITACEAGYRVPYSHFKDTTEEHTLTINFSELMVALGKCGFKLPDQIKVLSGLTQKGAALPSDWCRLSLGSQELKFHWTEKRTNDPD